MCANKNIRRAAMGVVLMLLGCGLAGRAWGFAGGTGEPNDPYQVATADDLISLGKDPNLLDKHFALVNDIDLDPNLPGGHIFSDALIAPDGSAEVSGHSGEEFRGVLDGRGHTIRNLHISGKPGYDAGLFGRFSGVVKSLHLQDVEIDGAPCGALAGLNHRGMIAHCSVTGRVSGSEDIGGMVGVNWDGVLMDCRSEVQVHGGAEVGGMVGGGPGGILTRCESRGNVEGDTFAGGLIGRMGQGEVLDCRAFGSVTGGDRVGGLAGDVFTVLISRCMADCQVVAEKTAGGLVGGDTFNILFITSSYARGSVAGTVVGGLVGNAADARIMDSYAACEIIGLAQDAASFAAGGLFGETRPRWAPVALACFWDAELSGVDVSTGQGPGLFGTSLTTAQMRTKATFEQAGWDFCTTWAMPQDGYPVLQWELTPDPNVCE